MTTEKSIAHIGSMNLYGERAHLDGLVPWSEASPPDIEHGKTQGRLRSCWYCGSMHPADVAAAIRAGATGSFADWKYGWPHKAYFDGVPYPYAGMLESCVGCSNPPDEEVAAGKWLRIPTGMFDPHTGDPTFTWTAPGTPAAPTTHGKFYSVHLQDATPEDRSTIEEYLGLRFDFTDDGKVGWKKL